MRFVCAALFGMIPFVLCGVVLCGETENEPKAEPEVKTDVVENESRAPSIEAPFGSLSIGVAIQTGYEFLPDEDEGDRNSFVLPHARFFLEGYLVSQQLTYLLSGDAVSGLETRGRRFGPGGETVSDSPDEEVPFLLDASLSFAIPQIDARVSIGRFVPAWGVLMPERVTRLGAISYPLYLHGSTGSIGRFRNIGVQAEIQVVDWLTVEGGIFNGGKNSWVDTNDHKDFLAGVRFNPVPGMVIRTSCFVGFPGVVDGVDSSGAPIEEGVEIHVQPIFEARYQDYGFDLILGGAADLTTRNSQDSRADYQAFGFLGHLGYTIVGDWLQVFARLDIWDPSSEFREDERFRLTAGPQFFLTGIHSQIRVNYMYDFYGSARAMCRNYLETGACYETGVDVSEVAPAAKRYSNALLVFFAVDI